MNIDQQFKELDRSIEDVKKNFRELDRMDKSLKKEIKKANAKLERIKISDKNAKTLMALGFSTKQAFFIAKVLDKVVYNLLV